MNILENDVDVDAVYFGTQLVLALIGYAGIQLPLKLAIGYT